MGIDFRRILNRLFDDQPGRHSGGAHCQVALAEKIGILKGWHLLFPRKRRKKKDIQSQVRREYAFS
jgi:hypothetical protein